MRASDGEELPRRRGETQHERDNAPQADRNHISALQAEAVGGPTHQRFSADGHSAVESRQNTDLFKAEPQMPGVKGQAEVDQAKAQTRKQTLAHNGHKRSVKFPLHFPPSP